MDFSNSKKYGTAMYPVHAEQTSGLLTRSESILTPELLVSRFLKGIPLIFPNGDEISMTDLKDKIYLATNEAEALIGTTITREAFKEKASFDMSLYNSYVHTRTEHGPIISLEHLSIVAANGQTIFEIPPEWIESANFSKNLINVIPLLASFGGSSVSGTPVSSNGNGAGPAFLAIWGSYGMAGQIPAYWNVQYTAGLSNKEGQVPTIVNELVGAIAAIDTLSLIAPSNLYNSQSLSQDGISQSSSGPGPMIYRTRIGELEEKRDMLVKKIKGIFFRKYFISNF